MEQSEHTAFGEAHADSGAYYDPGPTEPQKPGWHERISNWGKNLLSKDPTPRKPKTRSTIPTVSKSKQDGATRRATIPLDSKSRSGPPPPLPTVDGQLTPTLGFGPAKRPALCVAAENGTTSTVKRLLATGADIETCDAQRRTALSLAASGGHVATVRVLIEKGAKIESRDADEATPLIRAALQGHEGVVRVLLRSGANMEAEDSSRMTPLCQAVAQRHRKVVKLLVQRGANVAMRFDPSCDPISLAREAGDKAVVQLLERELHSRVQPVAAAGFGGYPHGMYPVQSPAPMGEPYPDFTTTAVQQVASPPSDGSPLPWNPYAQVSGPVWYGSASVGAKAADEQAPGQEAYAPGQPYQQGSTWRPAIAELGGG